MKITPYESVKIGYGFAWTNYNSLTNEIFPIPFNFIFRWARNVWLHCIKPDNNTVNIKAKIDESYRDGFQKGFEEGEKRFVDKILSIYKKSYF